MSIRSALVIGAFMLTIVVCTATSRAQDDKSVPESEFEKTDTDGSGAIDPMEFRDRMILIFRALDVDKNDVIELVEVPLDRRHLFHDVDRDGDGAVDNAEFLSYLLPRFAESDADGDRVLSLDEVRAADLLEYETNAPSAFELTDWDGNGVVDRDEFIARMRVIFEVLDGDSNGLVDLSEVAAEHKALFPKVDSDGSLGVDLDEQLAFARTLFVEVDTDKNGVLEPDEVRNANEPTGE